MQYTIIILIFILLLTYIWICKKEVEGFAIPIIDPYSLYLHADATRREELWRLAHRDNTIMSKF
jgi:hypothetical protein